MAGSGAEVNGCRRVFGPGHSPLRTIHSTLSNFFLHTCSFVRLSCSYITAKPSTRSLQLQTYPAVVILATDGIWDELGSDVAARVAADAAAGGVVQPASAIMNAAFDRAAASSRMTVSQLKSFPPGSERRRLVDDCTVVVGVFGVKSKL